MPKSKIPQVCIVNKNPSDFYLGANVVEETPIKPRRWDGRFNKVDKNIYACTMGGPVDHYGIGRVAPSPARFTTACVLDNKKTVIYKNGSRWRLEIYGFYLGGAKSFPIWVGNSKTSSILGEYTQTGGSENSTPSIILVAG